jgi:ComF family protein
MIHLFKFDGMTAVGEEFARRLAEAAVEAGVFDSVDLVVPVPLHYRRWIERGFNQSEVLSRRVAERLGKPHSGSALVRTRHTPPQSRLEPEERLRNLRGAFTARKEQVKGLTVLLVDDVTTTEATVRECAVALRRARAREIRILTLARAIQG